MNATLILSIAVLVFVLAWIKILLEMKDNFLFKQK